MNTIRQKILILTSRLLWWSLCLLIVSYVMPGQLPWIDSIRLPVQWKIMSSFGNIVFGGYVIDNELNITPSAETISFFELYPYITTLKPGDLFFTNSERYVSSLFIPGLRKHSVIYLGTKTQLKKFLGKKHPLYEALVPYYTHATILILDSSAHGVQIRDSTAISNLNQESYLTSIVWFHLLVTKTEKIRFIESALQHLGKPYDFDLLATEESAIYCSELLYRWLADIGIVLDQTSETFGRTIVTPNDAVAYLATRGIAMNYVALAFFLEKADSHLQNHTTTVLIEKTVASE